MLLGHTIYELTSRKLTILLMINKILHEKIMFPQKTFQANGHLKLQSSFAAYLILNNKTVQIIPPPKSNFLSQLSYDHDSQRNAGYLQIMVENLHLTLLKIKRQPHFFLSKAQLLCNSIDVTDSLTYSRTFVDRFGRSLRLCYNEFDEKVISDVKMPGIGGDFEFKVNIQS